MPYTLLFEKSAVNEKGFTTAKDAKRRKGVSLVFLSEPCVSVAVESALRNRTSINLKKEMH